MVEPKAPFRCALHELERRGQSVNSLRQRQSPLREIASCQKQRLKIWPLLLGGGPIELLNRLANPIVHARLHGHIGRLFVKTLSKRCAFSFIWMMRRKTILTHEVRGRHARLISASSLIDWGRLVHLGPTLCQARRSSMLDLLPCQASLWQLKWGHKIVGNKTELELLDR